MARVDVTITPAPGFSGGVELVLTTGDATNDHKLLNVTGRIVLVIKNDDASQHTATVIAVDKAVHADDVVVAVPAGKTYIVGPLPVDLFTQPSGTDQNYVQVDLDVATSVKLAAIAL